MIADRRPTACPYVRSDRLVTDPDAYDSNNHLRYARVHARGTEGGKSVRSVGEWTTLSRQVGGRAIGGGEPHAVLDRRRRTQRLRMRRTAPHGAARLHGRGDRAVSCVLQAGTRHQRRARGRGNLPGAGAAATAANRVLGKGQIRAAGAAPGNTLVEQPEIKVDRLDYAGPSVDAHRAGLGAKALSG